MIEQKEFENLDKLNSFLSEACPGMSLPPPLQASSPAKITVISIETCDYDYDTDLPLMSGKTFVTKRQGKRLYFTRS